MITTVLAEDHHVVRQGLRAVLDCEPDIEVAGEAADGLEALRVCSRVRPNVLVADLMMPNMGGLELTRAIRQHHPDTRVVILSIQSSTPYIHDAFVSGATGYVLKSARADNLVTAIRRVAAGQRYLSPPLSERDLERGPKTFERPLDVLEELTPRERQVLVLAAGGRTNAETGAQLGISPRTVEVHRANLMRKLRLRSHIDLVRYAMKRGILSDE